MTEIRLKKGEPVDKALRRLKKKLDREGTLKEVRNHRHFEKPSERRRRKEKAARFSAMLTARYADKISHTRAKVCDTRKTTPLLRAFEKYAVRCGGGANHRFGLDDAVLIKDNHIALAGGATAALRAAKSFVGHLTKIEIEVDTLDQLEEALREGADAVLLDNMSLSDLREAVRMIEGRMIAEASGGVTLETIAAIAETGVDLISVGALTHSACVLDLGLDVVVGR